jgi:hypothetical protein
MLTMSNPLTRTPQAAGGALELAIITIGWVRPDCVSQHDFSCVRLLSPESIYPAAPIGGIQLATWQVALADVRFPRRQTGARADQGTIESMGLKVTQKVQTEA